MYIFLGELTNTDFFKNIGQILRFLRSSRMMEFGIITNFEFMEGLYIIE